MNNIAVLTDSSRYLDEIYDFNPPKRELWKYDIDHPEEVADMIRAMLKTPEELFASCKKGKEKTLQKISWDLAAKSMMQAIR